jgi:toxin ParE1/3/4
MTPYRLRAAALADVEQASDHYFDIRPQLADEFRVELLAALEHVSRQPASGSPKYGAAARSPKAKAKLVRMWLLNRYPYAVFYMDTASGIDVIRVLHQASNIPKHLNKNNT